MVEMQDNINQVEGERRNLYDVIFSPFTAGFAVVCLVLTIFLPTDGLGVPICWFKAYFELPCPGCGLTRSVTCISHLQFGKAVSYHPFGPIVYALFVANAVLLFLPNAKRQAIKSRIVRNGRWMWIIYMTIVAAFLTFGIVRTLLTATLGVFDNV